MWKCSVENGCLLTGFRYVKGIGEEKGTLILNAREGSPFLSLQDFIDRTNLDNLSLQNLIAVGACETLQRSKRQLLWEAQTIRVAGGIFGVNKDKQENLPIPEMTIREETITDYAFQGFSASHHIMEPYSIEPGHKVVYRISRYLFGYYSFRRIGISI
jgi:DNA polymerase III alpha subunit